MNYICTWFCADEKGEESIFPQTGKKSSSQGHQNIYWKCVLLFYATSRRFNKGEMHVLFTNVKQLPIIEGKSVDAMLEELCVDVVVTNFKYKTPKGYFGMFQNQFYEFSILEYIVGHNKHSDDQYLILDSDCIFLKPAGALFEEAREKGFMSFEDDCTTELVIHGLSRRAMKELYSDLLKKEIDEIPGYHLGEFFLANVKNINTIFNDFLELWPELLRRNEAALPKFNEEAQTLSYLYYKNNFIANPARNLMKRLWTNPVFYRNVEPTDKDLIIWHLPSEKTYGLADLYTKMIQHREDFGFKWSDAEFLNTTQNTLGIPYLSPAKKIKYYVFSYSRALSKRAKKMVAGIF
jgi:hypothetical protein